MERNVIEISGASVCYRLAKQRIGSFKDYALHWLRGALTYEPLWALKDVNLTVGRSEGVAIIGRNGAGKSTLLKVVSRVLEPTQGAVVVRGSVAPILELGTGFDYELTGRENIYLNALLLGKTAREVEAKYDEIVDFSGLGDFIQSPIRNYSSGMVARLGFSIVTAWLPEVLVLDEFLAVGDAEFALKCKARVDGLRNAGAALIVVSHQEEMIERHCSRAVWLEHGVVMADGPIHRTLERYLEAATGSRNTTGQLV